VYEVSLCFDFFHSFPRMLDLLSFSFTFSIAAITLGSLAFPPCSVPVLPGDAFLAWVFAHLEQEGAGRLPHCS